MKKLTPIIFLLTSFFGYNQTKITLDEVQIGVNLTDPNFLNDFEPGLGFNLGANKVFRPDKTTELILKANYSLTNYKNAQFSSHSKYVSKEVITVNFHSLAYTFGPRFNLKDYLYLSADLVLDFNLRVFEKGIVHTHYINELPTTESYSGYYKGQVTPGVSMGIGKTFKVVNRTFFSEFQYYLMSNFDYTANRVSSLNLSLGIKI